MIFLYLQLSKRGRPQTPRTSYSYQDESPAKSAIGRTNFRIHNAGLSKHFYLIRSAAMAARNCSPGNSRFSVMFQDWWYVSFASLNAESKRRRTKFPGISLICSYSNSHLKTYNHPAARYRSRKDLPYAYAPSLSTLAVFLPHPVRCDCTRQRGSIFRV